VGLIESSEDWTNVHDEWRVSIHFAGKHYETSYHTGIGCRKPSRAVTKERGGWYSRLSDRFFKSDFEAAKAGFLLKVNPTLADVLYCLLSDANGVEQTFEEWASDLGYDSDSRKALKTYMACQKTRAALLKMFGSKLFEKLASLEH